MPLHFLVFAMLMAEIKRVTEVGIGDCGVAKQVVSEIRDTSA